MSAKNIPNKVPQYVAALSATLGATAMGMVLGYSSPTGLQLREDNTTNTNDSSSFVFNEDFRLSSGEVAWFSSIVSIGAVLVALVGAPILAKFGRRGTMLISLLPATAGWLLIALGVNFGMLMTGRVLSGIFSGLVCLCVNTYIAEVASPDVRGMLGAGFQLLINVGVLLVYVLGAYLHWYHLALVSAILPVVFAAAMFCMHESPTALLMKGRREEAAKSLQHFRGEHYDISIELKALEISVADAQRNKVSFSELRAPYIMKPLLIANGLMILQQMTGINAVLFNLSTIFKNAGTDMSESLSSTIIGVVMVFGTLIGTQLVDRAGRKLLLVLSSSILCVAQIGLGAYFYVLETDRDYAMTNLQWLPLVSLVVFVLAYSFGQGPIPWLMMGELFSANVRDQASAVCTAVVWLFCFITTVSFEAMQDAIHAYGVYWLFAAFCFVSALFDAFVVKETKGKTLDEITAMFGGPTQKLPKNLEKRCSVNLAYA